MTALQPDREPAWDTAGAKRKWGPGTLTTRQPQLQQDSRPATSGLRESPPQAPPPRLCRGDRPWDSHTHISKGGWSLPRLPLPTSQLLEPSPCRACSRTFYQQRRAAGGASRAVDARSPGPPTHAPPCCLREPRGKGGDSRAACCRLQQPPALAPAAGSSAHPGAPAHRLRALGPCPTACTDPLPGATAHDGHLVTSASPPRRTGTDTR